MKYFKSFFIFYEKLILKNKSNHEQSIKKITLNIYDHFYPQYIDCYFMDVIIGLYICGLRPPISFS